VKIAVILFNLGGPDSLEAVQPFLRNLFSDPAIITLPGWLRLPLARFIASRRTPKATAIYAKIGGSSPILGQTEAQARALEEALGSEHEWRGYVCMRYWHPLTEVVVRSVRRFAPDRIVLLPLYPQFSTTTTGSSFKAWQAAAADLKVPTATVESYPTEPGFIRASVELIKEGLGKTSGATRVLFSAHGLPEKTIKAGDPYQRQVEETAAAIGEHLGNVEWSVCYQSRVGPLRWIGPPTESEIRNAGAHKQSVVLYPISFVSEHSETLVELDIDYRQLATEAGVPAYVRVPTVGTHPLFIHGLANLVKAELMNSAWSTTS
jgi:ferrochelatase